MYSGIWVSSFVVNLCSMYSARLSIPFGFSGHSDVEIILIHVLSISFKYQICYK